MSVPPNIKGEDRSRAMGLQDLTGTKLGKYRILRQLGRGGMGVVYEAEDRRLQRCVAVKMLPCTLSEDPKILQRFLQEARIAAKLNHPNVVTVYDVDRQGEFVYIAMELMNGGSAQDLLDAQGALPWTAATRIIAHIARGLSAAHALNLVHRDIKPANMMLTESDTIKLADFGLAKGTDPSAAGLTRHGSVMGTPSYMSPEQCEGKQVEPRSDIYSLGAAYFALLTGRPPFVGQLPIQVAFAHCSSPIPDPRTIVPDVPEACVAIINRAMAKQPRSRYASADEMLEDLKRVTTVSLDGSDWNAPSATRHNREADSLAATQLLERAAVPGEAAAASAAASTVAVHQLETVRKVWDRLAETGRELSSRWSSRGSVQPVGRTTWVSRAAAVLDGLRGRSNQLAYACILLVLVVVLIGLLTDSSRQSNGTGRETALDHVWQHLLPGSSGQSGESVAPPVPVISPAEETERPVTSDHPIVIDASTVPANTSNQSPGPGPQPGVSPRRNGPGKPQRLPKTKPTTGETDGRPPHQTNGKTFPADAPTSSAAGLRPLDAFVPPTRQSPRSATRGVGP